MLAVGGLTALMLVAAALVVAAALGHSGHVPRNGGPSRTISPFGLGNSEGATVSGMTEYEAEDGAANAAVVGPGYAPGTLAGEASGRAAVEFRAAGQFVQFRLRARANALDVRYWLRPGAPGSLAVYVNGVRLGGNLPLLPGPASAGSRADGTALPVLYKDARIVLGRQLTSGDIVRLQAAPGDTALPCVIDVADFYQVPAPAPQPRGSISVTAEGADPTGTADSTGAFRKAITAAAAAKQPVWIPPGAFRVSSPLQLSKATITGAGDWYAQIVASEFIANPARVLGPVNLSGFAILGPPAASANPSPAAGSAAISGSLGTGSTVNSLWITGTGTGIRLRTTTEATVENCEVLSTAADGLDLDGGSADAWLRNNFIRNTGGDAIAIWSDSAITVSNDTVVQAAAGNGIADYGGAGTSLIDNVIADTSGSGITVSNDKLRPRGGFTPLSGTITVGDNTVLRSGAILPASRRPAGAVQVSSGTYPVTHVSVNVVDNTVDDSPYSAFTITSGTAGLPVTGVTYDGDTINGTGTVAFQADTPGSGTFNQVKAKRVGVPGVYNHPGTPRTAPFSFKLGSGNTGWHARPVLTTLPAPTGPAAPPSPKPSQPPPAPASATRSAAPRHTSAPAASPAVTPTAGNPVTAGPAPFVPRPRPSPGPSRQALEFTAAASSVLNGAGMRFSYSIPPAQRSSSNWVGIYHASQTPGATPYLAYQFAPGASGSVTIPTIGLDGPGSYQAELFHEDGYQKLAGPVYVSVVGAKPTLTAAAPSVSKGTSITLSYSVPPAMRKSSNWVGVYLASQTPGATPYLAYRFAPGASGSVTIPTTGLQGTGSYQAELFYDDGYQKLAGPVYVSVTSS